MPPINDNFNNRTTINGLPKTVFGTNIGGSGEAGEPSNAWASDPLASSWWTWIAPSSGEYVLTTIGSKTTWGDTFDTTLGVYTGNAVNNLTEVASIDDFWSGEAVTLNSVVRFSATAGTAYQISVDGWSGAEGNIVLNLARVTRGTGGANNLNGSNGSDYILAGAGNDNINGNGGYDVLFGEGGNDQINGGSLTDWIEGGTGNDVINGNGGGDILQGGDGNDRITGSSSDDQIYGGSGNDTIFGNGGNDYLSDYYGGNNQIYGGSGNDFIASGSGNDTIYGNGGNDYLYSGDGNNQIYGGSGNDDISSGSGNDTIYGNGGNDYIYSGSGADTIWLGSGAATVVLDSWWDTNGFDTINNFQLGQTNFQFYGDLSSLSFVDSAAGARILSDGDLIAVVSNTQASVFQNNSGIFV